MAYNNSTSERGICWAATIEVKDIFEWEPDHNIENKKFIKGIQGQLWSETITEKKFIDKMINPRLATLSEIAWRGKHHFPYNVGKNCVCCQGQAYLKCDPSIPGIIAYNCPNPYNNKYRMLDGRHRLMRHLFEGKTESKFYVFDFNLLKTKKKKKLKDFLDSDEIFDFL